MAFVEPGNWRDAIINFADTFIEHRYSNSPTNSDSGNFFNYSVCHFSSSITYRPISTIFPNYPTSMDVNRWIKEKKETARGRVIEFLLRESPFRWNWTGDVGNIYFLLVRIRNSAAPLEMRNLVRTKRACLSKYTARVFVTLSLLNQQKARSVVARLLPSSLVKSWNDTYSRYFGS